MSFHDDALRLRALRRYQLMFKTALAVLAVGVIMTFAGVGHIVAGHEPTLVSAGILLISLSCLNAYKFVTSTVALMEPDGPRTAR